MGSSFFSHLIVRKGAILVDGIDTSHTRSNGFTFEYRLLLTFSEKRDIVVDVFQDDVDSSFAGQLLYAVILHLKQIFKQQF